MGKEIEANWNELCQIVNILNEVCHGIDVNEIEFKYEDIFALLRKIASYEVEEDKSEIKKN